MPTPVSVTETSTRPSFWPARTSIRHAPWLADYIAINGPMWDLSPEDLKDLIKEHSWLRISEAEAQVYCNPPALALFAFTLTCAGRRTVVLAGKIASR